MPAKQTQPKATPAGECRRCSAFCDKLVEPRGCVEMGCRYLYSYVDMLTGAQFVGCMQKVFDVEIDLELLKEGQRGRSGFGAVKAQRQPLPMCRAEVSSCYEHRTDRLGCVNPEFFELPQGSPTFRVITRIEIQE